MASKKVPVTTSSSANNLGSGSVRKGGKSFIGIISRSSSTNTNLNTFQGVFGRELSDVLKSQGNSISAVIKAGIPIVVQETISWLEKNALQEEGLFRIPGEQSHVDKLKALYNNDCRAFGLIDFTAEKAGANTVAGLLKQYFRELPEPILTFRLYSTFIKVCKNEHEQVRKNNLRILIQKLPKDNYRVLMHLMVFLNKVLQHSQQNKMTSANLATCWAPNLLRSEKESHEQIMFDSEHVNNIIATLIEEVEFMSVPTSKEKEVALSPTMSKKQPSLEAVSPSIGEASTTTTTAVVSPTIVRSKEEVSPLVESKSGKGLQKSKSKSSYEKERRQTIAGGVSPILEHHGAPCHGWLYKQGGSIKSWKKRFFMLKGLILFYYKSDKNVSDPLGKISLPSYELMIASPEEAKNRPNLFKLASSSASGPARIWFFSAKTEMERDRWMKAIQEALDTYKQTKVTKIDVSMPPAPLLLPPILSIPGPSNAAPRPSKSADMANSNSLDDFQAEFHNEDSDSEDDEDSLSPPTTSVMSKSFSSVSLDDSHLSYDNHQNNESLGQESDILSEAAPQAPIEQTEEESIEDIERRLREEEESLLQTEKQLLEEEAKLEQDEV